VHARRPANRPSATDSFPCPSVARIHALRRGGAEDAWIPLWRKQSHEGPELLFKGFDFISQGDAKAMASAAVSRVLIGPYGLHAFLGLVLALFLGFLWLFNFTSFF
jgi:hypothetical protein